MLKYLKLAAGPLAALCLLLWGNLDPTHPETTRMAALTIWVAIWWLTEATHIAVTALLPFFMMPMLGITDTKTVSAQYMDQVIFLFIGGFLLAFAIERWRLHERLSLRILSVLGSSPIHILAGLMFITFFISMWLSNTATVMMLLSATTSLIVQLDRHTEQASASIAKALLLGLAYAASIGGMATPVGTPTNMIFISYFEKTYPNEPSIDFMQWFLMSFPLALLLLAVCFALLVWKHLRLHQSIKFDTQQFVEQYQKLGKWTWEEKVVAAVFSLTALLWFFRANLDIGVISFKGWSNLFQKPEYIQDSTVAIAMAFLLFFIPSQTKPKRNLLEWKDAQQLPFGIILLFGSGFALAKGFEVSGLGAWVAHYLTFVKDIPLALTIVTICLLVAILSEFASNVASIQLTLPILAAMAQSMQIDPLLLMIPATFAASLGFMLPIATAPNTIVFGTQRLKTNDMISTGIWLDLAGVMLISTICYFLCS
jgi:sodium-dependent dicarboxylate transporter 2/3/5